MQSQSALEPLKPPCSTKFLATLDPAQLDQREMIIQQKIADLPATQAHCLRYWLNFLDDPFGSASAEMGPQVPSLLLDAVDLKIDRLKHSLIGTPIEIVLEAMSKLEKHRNIAYEGDVEAAMSDAKIMASWPADLFALAYKRIWERFTYRRAVLASDFYREIAGEIEIRRSALIRYEQRRTRWAEQLDRRKRRSTAQLTKEERAEMANAFAIIKQKVGI